MMMYTLNFPNGMSQTYSTSGELMNAGGYNNVVHNFFVSSFNFNIGFVDRPEPVVLDLYLVKFAFGFGIKLNVVSVIGMVLGIYIMKWSGER